tara:strand:- start:302 stop:496 length:195 start_codon:yes stop_codon:yes gene_type:complete
MCLECGFYKGRQVMDLAAKKQAREARLQAKKAMITAQNQQVAPSEAEEVSAAPVGEATDEKKSE